LSLKTEDERILMQRVQVLREIGQD